MIAGGGEGEGADVLAFPIVFFTRFIALVLPIIPKACETKEIGNQT